MFPLALIIYIMLNNTHLVNQTLPLEEEYDILLREELKISLKEIEQIKAECADLSEFLEGDYYDGPEY